MYSYPTLAHLSHRLPTAVPHPGAPRACGASHAFFTRWWDLALLVLLITTVNLSLLWGRPALSLALHPASFGARNWWSVLTHPFAHVSLYHFLLDAGAFLGLYTMLSHRSPTRRFLVLATCAAGSVGAAILSPVFRQQGLCGLSGVAHGLMAVVCLDLVSSRDGWTVGIAGLAVLVVKCVAEALTGSVVFSSLHAGDVGTPVVLCHAGGVLGGLLATTFHSRHAVLMPQADGNRGCREDHPLSRRPRI